MIHAKSGDDYFLQQIVAMAFTGTVHSVFKHALNIRSDGNDEIFTLATKAMASVNNSSNSFKRRRIVSPFISTSCVWRFNLTFPASTT